MKLKNNQNSMKGIAKGKCALKPIQASKEVRGVTNFEIIAENSASSKAVHIDFWKKQVIKKKVNAKIVKNTNSMNKFPQDFFNSSAWDKSSDERECLNQRIHLSKKHNQSNYTRNKIKNDRQQFKLEIKGK